MEMIGMILMLVGGLGMLIFGIQLLIIAFKKSIGWGVASLLIPFVLLVFVIKNWEDCKTPFLRNVIAFVVYLAGAAVAFAGGGGTAGVAG